MTKYIKISVLARETAKKVCRGREQWIRYLDVASRLYKYPFEDQLLIYAQRPDATACASLEMWNERMFCWVNRGAKGIALIDGESERPKLRYVFDVSDVHKARRIGKDPFIWHLRWSSIFVTFTLKKIIDWNISFQTVSCIHLMNVDVYDYNSHIHNPMCFHLTRGLFQSDSVV